MSQAEKSAYYRELKEAGVAFSRPYREYTTDELRAAVLKLRAQQPQPEPETPAEADWPMPDWNEPEPAPRAEPKPAPKQPPAPPRTSTPREQYAAQRAYQPNEEQPLRTDPETGFIWYREEVQKPAFPKPRARRKLTYVDPGVKVQTAVADKFIESFEVAGNENRTGEVRITMPSYQVGVYKDPRYPFKIHVYNGTKGFDLFDVQKFYGGADLVPTDIKRMYVENDLCYDIRTVIRSIQSEYRDQQLGGQR